MSSRRIGYQDPEESASSMAACKSLGPREVQSAPAPTRLLFNSPDSDVGSRVDGTQKVTPLLRQFFDGGRRVQPLFARFQAKASVIGYAQRCGKAGQSPETSTRSRAARAAHAESTVSQISLPSEHMDRAAVPVISTPPLIIPQRWSTLLQPRRDPAEAGPPARAFIFRLTSIH